MWQTSPGNSRPSRLEKQKERASLDPELEEHVMEDVLKDFKRRIDDKKQKFQAKWDLLQQENQLKLKEMKQAEAVAQKESKQQQTVFREQAEQAERETQERIWAAKDIVPSTKRYVIVAWNRAELMKQSGREIKRMRVARVRIQASVQLQRGQEMEVCLFLSVFLSFFPSFSFVSFYRPWALITGG